MSPLPNDPFALVGSTLDDRFAIDAVVARGGFGVVYKGRQLRLRKPIALKVLSPPGLGPDERRIFLDGFAQEAQTIAQLNHPGIVQVFDFGISRSPNGQEIPWMALEWIDGRTLADFLQERQGKPLSPGEALAILRPVVQALAFAHAKGFAHRDIKPSNIMLVGGRDVSLAGVVSTRLLDFGIAKVMNPNEGTTSGETQTHATFRAFSLPYASPEQRSALKTGPWTDVHALGLVLTEMLTGCAPYPGADRLDVELRIMSPERPTPALFQIDVGPWEALIRKAVSLRPPERFQDAGSFLAALEAHVPTSRAVTFNVPSTTEPMTVLRGSFEPPISSHPFTSGDVLASTITNAPTVSTTPPRPPSSRRALLAVSGVGAALLVLAATFAGIVLVSRSNTGSQPPLNATAATTAPVTPPAPATTRTEAPRTMPPTPPPRTVIAPIAMRDASVTAPPTVQRVAVAPPTPPPPRQAVVTPRARAPRAGAARPTPHLPD
jgi:serine/threonine-protein kinase